VPSCKLNGTAELAGTVPQVLKGLGYATIVSGKYHILNGGDWDDYDTTIASIQEAGFSDDGGTWYTNMGSTSLEFSHNLEYAVNKSLNAVAAALDVGQPFFLYFAATAPHAPIMQTALEFSMLATPEGTLMEAPTTTMPDRGTISGRISGASGRSERSIALGTVWFDDAVGAILDHLEGKRGVLDDTIVITYMDHGMAAKDSLYEGGIRIAHAVRYPKFIQGGTVLDDIVSSMDFGSTIFEVVGVDASSLTGTSWWGLVTGEGRNAPAAIVSEISLDRAVVAKHFKLLSSESGDTTDNYPASGEVIQLYNLDEDPTEQTNLAASNDHAGILTQMMAYLACHVASTLPKGEDSCDLTTMNELDLEE